MTLAELKGYLSAIAKQEGQRMEHQAAHNINSIGTAIGALG